MKNIFKALGLMVPAVFFCASMISFCCAASDLFPPYQEAPLYTTYFNDGQPNNTYYCAPNGNNSNDGKTILTPWFDLRGGAGIIKPGDLVLFRGGTYTGFTNGTCSGCSIYSLNRLTTAGTASDRIVIKNYPGETPILSSLTAFAMTLYDYQVLDGFKFIGGISTYHWNVVIQNCDFSSGTYGQDGTNASMIFTGTETPYASNLTIRNNSFHDSVNPGNGRVYAICLFEENFNGYAWNSGYTKIYYNKFYNINGATSQKFIIYNKDTGHGMDIAYNRFYNSNAFAVGGWGQAVGDDMDPPQPNANIQDYKFHHNLIYNCSGLGFYWGEAIGAVWHNNTVIDGGYTGTPYYDGSAGETRGFSCMYNSHPSPQTWGQVYDNAFYVDTPSKWFEAGDTTGYFNWVDYNAYPSETVKNLFENQNGATTNWQQHTVIAPDQFNIDSNYFATIPDNSPLRNAGRSNGTIGGFTFGSTNPYDLNGDGIVNVQDVTICVNMVLAGTKNIADLMAVVNEALK